MIGANYDPFGCIEIEILRLLKDAQEIKVTSLAAELGEDFDIAYGHCLLLSDEGIIEEFHEEALIKPARYPVEKIGFHLTEKGRKICNTFGM